MRYIPAAYLFHFLSIKRGIEKIPKVFQRFHPINKNISPIVKILIYNMNIIGNKLSPVAQGVKNAQRIAGLPFIRDVQQYFSVQFLLQHLFKPENFFVFPIF